MLAEVGLPGGLIALALFGFNLGVELGQLAIAADVQPPALALRGRTICRRGLLPAGSLAIAVFANTRLLQRAFDVSLW